MKEVEPQEKPAKKKRRLAPVLFGLLFLVGFGILAYPTISNQWNTYRQNQLISNYEITYNPWMRRILPMSGRKRKPLIRPLPTMISTEMCLAKMTVI